MGQVMVEKNSTYVVSVEDDSSFKMICHSLQCDNSLINYEQLNGDRIKIVSGKRI